MKVELINSLAYEKLMNENDGYCPCSIVKNDDTKCMCKEFRESNAEGECCCGVFRKVVRE